VNPQLFRLTASPSTIRNLTCSFHRIFGRTLSIYFPVSNWQLSPWGLSSGTQAGILAVRQRHTSQT